MWSSSRPRIPAKKFREESVDSLSRGLPSNHNFSQMIYEMSFSSQPFDGLRGGQNRLCGDELWRCLSVELRNIRRDGEELRAWGASDRV
jgi:hypothetical protein